MFGMFNDKNVDDAPFCEQIYHGWAVKVPEIDTLNIWKLHPDAFISDWYRYMDSGFTAARARDMSADADKTHRKDLKHNWRHVGNADNWRFRWFY